MDTEMDLLGGAGIGKDFAIHFLERGSQCVNDVNLGFFPAPHQDLSLEVGQADTRFTCAVKGLFLAFLTGGVCFLVGVILYRRAQRERTAAAEAAVPRPARALAAILNSPAQPGTQPE